MIAPAGAPAAEPVGGLEALGASLTATPTLAGRPMGFSGRIAVPQDALVGVELRAGDGAWQRVATARAGSGGAFTAQWPVAQLGAFTARAVPAGDAQAAQAGAAPLAPAMVLRGATATWYDLSGRMGACGVRLRKRTIGVAHRSLPCGSRVELAYGDRTVSATVVDRGPSVRSVTYDLTIAAARRLGIVAVGRARIGVLPDGERMPQSPIAAVPPALGAAGGLTAAP